MEPKLPLSVLAPQLSVTTTPTHAATSNVAAFPAPLVKYGNNTLPHLTSSPRASPRAPRSLTSSPTGDITKRRRKPVDISQRRRVVESIDVIGQEYEQQQEQQQSSGQDAGGHARTSSTINDASASHAAPATHTSSAATVGLPPPMLRAHTVTQTADGGSGRPTARRQTSTLPISHITHSPQPTRPAAHSPAPRTAAHHRSSSVVQDPYAERNASFLKQLPASTYTRHTLVNDLSSLASLHLADQEAEGQMDSKPTEQNDSAPLTDSSSTLSSTAAAPPSDPTTASSAHTADALDTSVPQPTATNEVVAQSPAQADTSPPAQLPATVEQPAPPSLSSSNQANDGANETIVLSSIEPQPNSTAHDELIRAPAFPPRHSPSPSHSPPLSSSPPTRSASNSLSQTVRKASFHSVYEQDGDGEEEVGAKLIKHTMKSSAAAALASSPDDEDMAAVYRTYKPARSSDDDDDDDDRILEAVKKHLAKAGGRFGAATQHSSDEEEEDISPQPKPKPKPQPKVQPKAQPKPQPQPQPQPQARPPLSSSPPSAQTNASFNPPLLPPSNHTSPVKQPKSRMAPPSPAVTDSDLQRLEKSSLAFEDNLAAMDRTLSIPRSSQTTSMLAQALQAAEEEDEDFDDESNTSGVQSPPMQHLSSSPSLSHSLSSSPAHVTSLIRPIPTKHRKTIKSIVVESGDDYEIIINALDGTPTTPRADMLSHGLSRSPASPSLSAARPASRPQLAVAGLNYMPDYFQQGGQGHATVEDVDDGGRARSPARSIPAQATVVPSSSSSALAALSASPMEKGSYITMLIHPQRRGKVADMLSAQDYTCNTCSTRLSNSYFNRPRYCHYTNALYCSSCHTKKVQYIPWRLLTLGETKQYKVCDLAASYLETMYTVPALPFSAISPELLQRSQDLRYIYILRQQLAHIRAFIFTCKKKDSLLKLLGDRVYFLYDSLVIPKGEGESEEAGAQKQLALPLQKAANPAPSMYGMSVTSDLVPTLGTQHHMAHGQGQGQGQMLLTPPSPHLLLHQYNSSSGSTAAAQNPPPTTSTTIGTSISNRSASPLTLGPAATSNAPTASSRASTSSMGLGRPSTPINIGSGVPSSAPNLNAGMQPSSSFDDFTGMEAEYENPSLRDMYSIRDLVEMLNGTLLSKLEPVVKQLIAHIIGGRCEICLSKGFYCEVPGCPRPNEAIYAFQLHTVIQCANCHSFFHRTCFQPAACPKCQRLKQRQEQLMQQKQQLKQLYINTGSPSLGLGIGGNGPLSSTRLALRSSSPINTFRSITTTGTGAGTVADSPSTNSGIDQYLNRRSNSPIGHSRGLSRAMPIQ